jgi:chromosome segregation protein
MDEVIFGGAETRKPVGMAEVRLVLAKDGKPETEMRDYDEFMIARRLFRDGESQYEINNVTCRLSDVIDFFLDTGVGRNSYAIIEQGRVDMITASKAEDRRAFIEEAAGVNKYKSRRESAVKTLEATKLNLSRISDITAEVRRQSDSLKRQARTAERRSELENRLKALELNLYAFRAHELRSKRLVLRELIEDALSQAAACDETIASKTILSDELSLRVSRLREESARIRDRRHEVELAHALQSAKIESCRGALERIEEVESRFERETAHLLESAKESTERADRLRVALADLERERDIVCGRLASSIEEFQTRESLVTKCRSEAEQARENLFQAQRKAAEARNRLDAVEKKLVLMQSERSNTEAERSSLTAQVEAIAEQLSPKQDELDQVGVHLAVREEETTSLSQRRETLRRDAAHAIDELRRCELELSDVSARRESIETMLKSFHLHGEDIAFLMSHDQIAGFDPQPTPLVDALRVSRGFEKALSAALESHGQCLVTTDLRSALEIARIAKDLPVGRITLLPLDATVSPLRESAALPPGTVCLREKVEAKEGHGRLKDSMLTGVAVAPDLAQARETQRTSPHPIDVVTLDGDRLSPWGGVVTGGVGPKGAEVFDQRARLEELQARSRACERKQDEASSLLADVRNDLAHVELRLNAARQEHERLRQRSAELRREIAERRAHIDAWTARVSVLRTQSERIFAEIEAHSARLPQVKREVETARSQVNDAQARLNRAALDLERAETQMRESASVHADLRVQSARIDAAVDGLRKELRAAQSEITRFSERIAALEKEKGRNKEERAAREAELRNLAAGAPLLKAEFDELSRASEAIETEVSATEAKLASLREEIMRARLDATKVRGKAHAAELEAAQHEQALAGLIEKAAERYGVDPLSLAPPAVPPQSDEIAALKSKLAAFGAVNPAALSECRRVEERLAFLVSQEQDLKSAVDALHETILRIDQETKERFEQAFRAIDDQFQEIFPFLFGGGRARLELTEPDHILETGVEILASPPGKKIRNMDLLSGGEKALTAVALVFAMFLTRPSPFCLLDEVDAPLDESNIMRFNEMLAKLSEDTQFLVVTHNKRSMAAADILYGVTMAEPGVSSVVSVRFSDQGNVRRRHGGEIDM